MTKDHDIKLASLKLNLSTLALLLILVGVVAPAVLYSCNLKQPTPEEVLIAICISLFSGVVFLWILDATSILPFRTEWIAKSVYGAAIVSVLGASVAVYKDAFHERKYPYEGEWRIVIQSIDSDAILIDHSILLHYSSSIKSYWGYSNIIVDLPDDSTKYTWCEITDFLPKEENLEIRLVKYNGVHKLLEFSIKEERKGSLFRSKNDSEIEFSLKLLRDK